MNSQERIAPRLRGCNAGRGLLSRHCLFQAVAHAMVISSVVCAVSIAVATESDIDKLVGQPADIASSAYQYRADRNAKQNPPESWFALMRYANQPLNKPADANAPAIKQALCGLLWEEIRPVKTLELTWAADAKRRPAPEELAVTTLDNQGTASSWWNNLAAVKQAVKPTVSADGTTYVYDLAKDTCGIVVSVVGDKIAADYDVPTVRVLVADTWKKMDIEIEWGFDKSTAEKDYSGRIETYDGVVTGLRPLDGDGSTTAVDCRFVAFPRQEFRPPGREVQSAVHGHVEVAAGATVHQPAGRRGANHRDAVDQGGQLLLPGGRPGEWPDPGAGVRVLCPSDFGAGVAVRDFARAPVALASQAASARGIHHGTPGPETEHHPPANRAPMKNRPGGRRHCDARRQPAAHPKPPAGLGTGHAGPSAVGTIDGPMESGGLASRAALRKEPEERPAVVQRLSLRHPGRGDLHDPRALDLMGSHQAAEDGFDQWVSLPMDPKLGPGHHPWALPDRPNGLFSEGHGCLTHAVGPDGAGGHMDGVHAFGPGSIGWALTEHYWMTGDKKWLKAAAPRIKANAEWMLRQRQVLVEHGSRRRTSLVQGPATGVSGDSRQRRLVDAVLRVPRPTTGRPSRDWRPRLSVIDPDGGARLTAEAEAYRKDLRAAVDRSIALSPVVPVRDGTFHSVIPFACYVRGLSTGAWGWQRDGSGSARRPAVLGNRPVGGGAGESGRTVVAQTTCGCRDTSMCWKIGCSWRMPMSEIGDWFLAGWQYQGGLERTANMHLAGDDIPVFLRSFLNCYAIDILPDDGYVFNEHAVHGPPDKIFEEAAFLERFRNLLVMEDGDSLWLARATPRAWLEQGKKISVKNAPTHFGTVGYEIVSDVDNGKIAATVEMPSRNPPKSVLLRLRHPKALPMKSVTVNGSPWTDFDPAKEAISLHDVTGTVKVECNY